MKKRIPRWTTMRKSISDGFVLKTDTDLKWEKRISSLSTKISARELMKIYKSKKIKL